MNFNAMLAPKENNKRAEVQQVEKDAVNRKIS